MNTPDDTAGNRQPETQRNEALEKLLTELNLCLGSCTRQPEVAPSEHLPKVFIFGPMRSGTTLLLQSLAASGVLAYPSNLLSRFYSAPLIGARIEQMLLDPTYRFREEFDDLQETVEFRSYNGKTRGIRSPNEFWYFWRRFLASHESGGDTFKPDAKTSFQAELNSLANLYRKPFALKALIMNEQIPSLFDVFPGSIYIRVHRNPAFNIQSTLEARVRQSGSMENWYSFPTSVFKQLQDLNPLDAVAGQVYAMNSAVQAGFNSVPDSQRIDIAYEDFCAAPEAFFKQLALQLDHLGHPIDLANATLPKPFENANQWRLEPYSQDDALAAYDRMARKLNLTRTNAER